MRSAWSLLFSRFYNPKSLNLSAREKMNTSVGFEHLGWLLLALKSGARQPPASCMCRYEPNNLVHSSAVCVLKMAHMLM